MVFFFFFCVPRDRTPLLYGSFMECDKKLIVRFSPSFFPSPLSFFRLHLRFLLPPSRVFSQNFPCSAIFPPDLFFPPPSSRASFFLFSPPKRCRFLLSAVSPGGRRVFCHRLPPPPPWFCLAGPPGPSNFPPSLALFHRKQPFGAFMASSLAPPPRSGGTAP